MKKLIAMLLVLTMVLSFAACAKTAPEAAAPATEAPATEAPATEAPATEPATEAPETEPEEVEPVYMTHDQFMAAPLDTYVTIETAVLDHQSWWDNKVTVYCHGEDGAYFLYEMACTEEESELLTLGTKIRVTGYKSEWAGEVEITDATFEILEGTFELQLEDVVDAAALLGTDELIQHQNEAVTFDGMTIESIEYKNGEPGDDIYVTMSKDGQTCDFCVEVYLTGTDSDVYQTVGTLKAGDVVNVGAYLYWYNGANPHIAYIELA